jgi:threonyl-tRNA synthetase
MSCREEGLFTRVSQNLTGICFKVAELGKVHRLNCQGPWRAFSGLCNSPKMMRTFSARREIENEVANISDLIFKVYKKIQLDF